MFGGFGKAMSGFGKNIKGAMMGGGGVNAGPSGSFMSRLGKNAPGMLNAAAQQYGGDFKGTAKLTGNMMKGRVQPGQGQPAQQQEGGVQTGPSAMPGGMMPFMPAINQASGLFGNMMGRPDFMSKMGGNTGISGGLFNRPGGFGNGFMDPGRMGGLVGPDGPIGPPSGSIFSRIYGNMGGEGMPNRPQIYY